MDRGLTFTIIAIVLVAMMTIDRMVLGVGELRGVLATWTCFSSPESYSVDMGEATMEECRKVVPASAEWIFKCTASSPHI